MTTSSLFVRVGAEDVRIAADTHFRDRALPGEAERRDRFIRFLDATPKGTYLVLSATSSISISSTARSSPVATSTSARPSPAPPRAASTPNSSAATTTTGWATSSRANSALRVHEKEIAIEAQGRKLVLAHGDLVMPRDYGYKVLKSVIRNRAVIAASRWIHPDLLDAIAGGVAHGSRKYFTRARRRSVRARWPRTRGSISSRGGTMPS